jgi:hypothetical protein
MDVSGESECRSWFARYPCHHFVVVVAKRAWNANALAGLLAPV